jgi:hypothetical protein
MRPLPVLLVALAIALALPSASSASVAIGSNLSATGNNGPGGCNSICTGTNLVLPANSRAAGGLTAPTDGVVVRWRMSSGSSGNPVELRVLHPAGGNPSRFTGQGKSSTQQTIGAPTPVFPTRLAIRAGDSVGLDAHNSALVWADTMGASSLSWSVTNGFTDGLKEGTTGDGSSEALELLVQAVIEADADKDGFGDETQDGCPGDAARQTPPCGTGNTNPNGNPPPPTVETPKLSSAKVTPASFRLGSLAHIKFKLSKDATYKLTFDQAKAGRRRGKRCVPQSRTVKTGTKCTAYVRRGTRSGTGKTGQNDISFRGRLAGKALPLGRYRVTFGAKDAAGNTASSKTAFFKLRPRLTPSR